MSIDEHPTNVTKLFADDKNKEDDYDFDNPPYGGSLSEFVKWYNERFAVITDGGITRTYKIHKNGKVEMYKSNDDFFGAYAYVKVQAKSEGGDIGKIYDTAKLWYSHNANRRTFHSATFDPHNAAPPNVFNFWPGFGVKPIQGDCHLTKAYFNLNSAVGSDRRS